MISFSSLVGDGACLQDMRMFHQDRSRLNRENVVLTREINDLRRKAKALALQQNGVERVRCIAVDDMVWCRVACRLGRFVLYCTVASYNSTYNTPPQNRPPLSWFAIEFLCPCRE